MQGLTIIKILSFLSALGLSFKSALLISDLYELSLWLIVICGILLFTALYVSIFYLLKYVAITGKKCTRLLDSASIETIIGGTIGLLIGVLIGILGGYPFTQLKTYGIYISLLILFLFSFLGLTVGTRRTKDLLRTLPFVKKGEKPAPKRLPAHKKVLDTSAIIDGRIYDVCKSSFLEGVLVVPIFVIEELQHIADSEDALRRTKGRHGLDLLASMQQDKHINIEIYDDPLNSEKEVDMKLIRLCQKLEADIITNDYNLNKVAELQGIKVLNINELANALKIIVYPGEMMTITVIKEGKEENQGVGYLEDGTMVVIEDANKDLGKNLSVTVTSVFQTAAGRMIFTRKSKPTDFEMTGS